MPAEPRFDIHVHLTGVGTGESGCRVSADFQERYTFRLIRRLYGITPEQMVSTVDSDWVDMIVGWVTESELDYAVVLGFDGVYSRDGSMDESCTQMIVPADWVFASCRRHRCLLPGPSINPFRRDAMAVLEKAVEQGAALIKWLPMAQGIDPSDPRTKDFYRVLAAERIPLLIHMGGERTFATVDPTLNDVTLLRAPLDAGVPVICAHTATRILFSREPDQLPVLFGMLTEYPHLWVDNSGMCNPGRYAHLPVLARDSRMWERTLYGSDFPVPSNAAYFLKELGARAVWRLDREQRNPFQRDVQIKRALGYPDRTLSSAGGVLANVEKWVGR